MGPWAGQSDVYSATFLMHCNVLEGGLGTTLNQHTLEWSVPVGYIIHPTATFRVSVAVAHMLYPPAKFRAERDNGTYNGTSPCHVQRGRSLPVRYIMYPPATFRVERGSGMYVISSDPPIHLYDWLSESDLGALAQRSLSESDGF